MPHSQSSNANLDAETSLPESETPQKNKSGCWWKAVVVGVALLTVLFVIQQMIRPVADPDDIVPVVVSPKDSVKEDSGIQEPESTDAPEPSVNLPPGAITAGVSQKIIDEADHPFDPLMILADQLIANMDQKVQDYSATLVSQVAIKGKVLEEKFVFVKIRNEHTVEGNKLPFSVYTRFLKPEKSTGTEAIWVEGRNEGKLIGHAVGLMNIKRFYLAPTGAIAMDGNLHPIYRIGMRNLLVELKKTGAKASKAADCEVSMQREVDINGRLCTMFQARFPEKRPELESHIARIYIDDELNVPIAYQGYLWPESPGGELPLIEKYYYTDLKINVGLTDADFDPGNEDYDYPGW